MKPLWKCPREERAMVLGRRELLLTGIDDLNKTIENLRNIIAIHTRTLHELHRKFEDLYRQYDFTEVDTQPVSDILNP